jgi:hypothetical protein
MENYTKYLIYLKSLFSYSPVNPQLLIMRREPILFAVIVFFDWFYGDYFYKLDDFNNMNDDDNIYDAIDEDFFNKSS